jgi:hypothetical protein
MERFLNESATYAESLYAESTIRANDGEHTERDCELVEEQLKRYSKDQEDTSDRGAFGVGEKDLQQLSDLHHELQRYKRDKESGRDTPVIGERSKSDEIIGIQNAEISILESINQTRMSKHEALAKLHSQLRLEYLDSLRMYKCAEAKALNELRQAEQKIVQVRSEKERMQMAIQQEFMEMKKAHKQRLDKVEKEYYKAQKEREQAQMEKEKALSEREQGQMEKEKALSELRQAEQKIIQARNERECLLMAIKQELMEIKKAHEQQLGKAEMERDQAKMERCQAFDEREELKRERRQILSERNQAVSDSATLNQYLAAMKESTASTRGILEQHVKDMTLALDKKVIEPSYLASRL